MDIRAVSCSECLLLGYAMTADFSHAKHAKLMYVQHERRHSKRAYENVQAMLPSVLKVCTNVVSASTVACSSALLFMALLSYCACMHHSVHIRDSNH